METVACHKDSQKRIIVFKIQWNPGLRFPSKSYSKMYGAEPRFNDIRFNDIPCLTMGTLFPESKIFPGITIKSTWLTKQT